MNVGKNSRATTAGILALLFVFSPPSTTTSEEKKIEVKAAERIAQEQLKEQIGEAMTRTGSKELPGGLSNANIQKLAVIDFEASISSWESISASQKQKFSQMIIKLSEVDPVAALSNTDVKKTWLQREDIDFAIVELAAPVDFTLTHVEAGDAQVPYAIHVKPDEVRRMILPLKNGHVVVRGTFPSGERFIYHVMTNSKELAVSILPAGIRQSGEIKIFSKPSGSVVYLNGRRHYKSTPVDVLLESGLWKIKIEKAGFKAWTSNEIQLQEGEPYVLDIVLLSEHSR